MNPRTELYKGFVFWTKDVCGMDFSRKLRNGQIGVHLSDTTDVYRLGDAYLKDDGQRSLVGFEFELTEIVDKILRGSSKTEHLSKIWLLMMSKSL